MQPLVEQLRMNHHAEIDDMLLKRPFLGLRRIGPVRRKRRIIIALLPNPLRQHQQPGLLRLLKQPCQSPQPFVPAVLPPVLQRIRRQMASQLAERLHQRRGDPRVARPTVPHMKHFRQQEQRPHVVVRPLLDRAWANPAIGALVCENGVDITLCAGFHIVVVQQPGQIDETVQPIWHALPAFRLAADPSGILHIRPEFIKVTGLSIRLQLQLTTQPSLRRQCAAIDKPAKCFSQFHVHSFFQ